ncbi:uncharacterized protein N7446_002676 [Penicillium canescens]|uniref:Uncharacterized protein n=1 Tax=Penicillium canescens TaxID=5083 RepID=A0AAD6IEK3_PENCN|nr:uncharacterized protein N7446_002676 [Penicillium canescens]KAJ6044482.1 hypothetical protein N7460_005837 [Penicillium canescens]KAJ6055952.1 hypothetical protein N7444_005050 [Penicillium canescens]KAJ6074899.1 hypothetical protein N7446_002676 [Penicillium canescens]
MCHNGPTSRRCRGQHVWTLSTTVIDHSLQSSDLREEEVYVADETGVQVHFSQAIGQGSWCNLEGNEGGHSVWDHKSAGAGYSKIPDLTVTGRLPYLS